MFSASSLKIPIGFEPAAFIAVADFSTVAERTALVGGASYLEALVIVPGMHQQQSANDVSNGEYPPATSLANGYIFNIENPATVSYLQRISCAGCLVSAKVEPKTEAGFKQQIPYFRDIHLSLPNHHGGVPGALLYLLCPISTVIVFGILGSLRDWWALGILGILVLSRTINVFVIKRRASDSSRWKGGEEPGNPDGDLLIVLSQNRWVRLRGKLSDVKKVTAGQWLREMTVYENLAISSATVLVYASAAFVGNATNVDGWLIACLMLWSLALLGWCNAKTQCLQMYNCIVRVDLEKPMKYYPRRLTMVKHFIEESGRSDWAVRMGLIMEDVLDHNVRLPGNGLGQN
ncbi:hypothetical protein IW261DRAFT_1507952 [Armillaria novae-zelandiae]|uniref:Uncharacterized protein n=1 Tax=Armillaria novae-zelandiae TaxID=153914 RepID=A0AA39NVB4_9AGAR|nr:hypothetical protein IW261DRAFT_1507952 [Armillaria novae-zelandiae]